MNSWEGFKHGRWQDVIDVKDFIINNYNEYLGDSSFLEKPTVRTEKLNQRLLDLLKEEIRNNSNLGMDTSVVSSITSHEPGYIERDLELIVGLQTDKPLKRAFFPYGGIKVAINACKSYGYEVKEETEKIFTEYRKTHNQGVFDVYTKDIRKARRSHIITGLPDGYGRGRIIGDYRRVALYGVDFLISERKKDKEAITFPMTEDKIREAEEMADQIKSLEQLKQLAKSYGFDISMPASNAKEAIQWLYFGYLAAIKEQNGAAMSLGRTSTFIDIYIERDLQKGNINEIEAQELIDHFIMKLRMVRYARTPEYNALFTGDPSWVTESLGGMQKDNKKSLVTKTAYRYLQTLYNLGTSPEPNLTVLWANKLPEKFKEFCSRVSIDTSSIQYENDDKMRKYHGDDYAIACCVSPMEIGKSMQFFGARANLAKALLYAINGGKDELSGEQVGPVSEIYNKSILEFDDVMARFDKMLDWLCNTYVNALNIIHYMHDKYAYEKIQMALHDPKIIRTFATGIAGLSVVTDSLSAIKYAQVSPIYAENGLVVDYLITGEYPVYGNDDDRADDIAIDVIKRFMSKIRKNKTYRKAIPTLSILTITSNVVYGKNTGSTPDGRKAGEPFAPGANPMHGRDRSGALKSLSSVAKLPYCDCRDGISNTFTLVPEALGKDSIIQDVKACNLKTVIDGYFKKGGYHINVNILNREVLSDAMNNPDKYPNLTIRVSGYAVNFAKLTIEQKKEVISRTFHGTI